MTRRRWLVCALLFFAATVNYIDRQVLGLLKPLLQSQMGWNEIDYSNIVLAFQLAYAVGLIVVGKVIDKVGTRVGLAVAVVVWSAAAMLHAAASSVFQFAVARLALGLGESGSFPASIKAVAEWFPKKERALATGIFNSGTNVGALVTPLAVPWLTYRFGWRAAFIWTGAIGFVWLVLWLLLYRKPEDDKKVSAEELNYIRSDPPDKVVSVPLWRVISLRQTWAVAFGKIFADPIWWVYLFWIPDFLSRRFGLELKAMAWPLIIIYTGASLGSLGGGWLSSALLKRGWSVNASRKTALLTCAIAVTPVFFASQTDNVWIAVGLVALATGAHQGWSANVFTLASDMLPKNAVASVIGFATMTGAITGMLIAKAVGYILEWTGSYVPVFAIAASAYLVSILFIHIFAPRMEPAKIEVAS